MPLSDNHFKENLLFHLSKAHQGQSKAIRISELAKCFDVSGRKIRQILCELNFAGHPVLTSTRDPYGVYFGITQKEIGEYKANLKSRITAMFERLRALDKIEAKEFWKQMEMFGWPIA